MCLQQTEAQTSQSTAFPSEHENDHDRVHLLFQQIALREYEDDVEYVCQQIPGYA